MSVSVKHNTAFGKGPEHCILGKEACLVDCKSNDPKLEKEEPHARMNLSPFTTTKQRSNSMRQIEGSRQPRKGKPLNWEERIQIETLQREGYSEHDIGKRIDRSARTINREFTRGSG